MNTTIALITLAVCFGGVALGIARVERRAKRCAAHDPRAGRLAVALGYFCGILAVALLVAAFLLPVG